MPCYLGLLGPEAWYQRGPSKRYDLVKFLFSFIAAGQEYFSTALPMPLAVSLHGSYD